MSALCVVQYPVVAAAAAAVTSRRGQRLQLELKQERSSENCHKGQCQHNGGTQPSLPSAVHFFLLAVSNSDCNRTVALLRLALVGR